MAPRGHVATPREPTQTHMGAYMARSINRAKLIGPIGVVGPRERMGGVLGPLGDAKSQWSLSFNKQNLPCLLPCGTNMFHPFCRRHGEL